MPTLNRELTETARRYLPRYLWDKLGDSPGRGVLLNVLEWLRSIQYLLSTYLPSHLVQDKLSDPQPGKIQGRDLSGNLLFADVSGFTALSERLATYGHEGAEQLTGIINRYFDRMLDILAWSGGILVKFAGDAMLVYFPRQDKDKQAAQAVRAAQRMMLAMSEFSTIPTPRETVALKMKIGITGGQFWAASIGSAQRMEYVVMGETVARIMEAEGNAQAGQVVVDQATLDALGEWPSQPCAPGLHIVEPVSAEALGSFEIKAGAVKRVRGAAPWLADYDQTIGEIADMLKQIESLAPYLPAELVERISATAKQRQLESEFRPVATMFVNVTGLETLATPLGGEIVTRLWSEYFRAMTTIIRGLGGVVTRIDPYKQGSKMLVLFGAPVTHEDDAQRAMRAALDMRAELAALNDVWQRAHGSRLPAGRGALVQQRIGITYGLTFAGQAGSQTRREYTVMGDDVNLAARLMSSAEPDQILVTQALYDRVAEHFVATSLAPIRVKGKSQPISICQVDGLRQDRLARRLQTQGPLLGREAELAQCRDIVICALAGRGELLVIRSGPGMGKRHLASAVVGYAWAKGARVLDIECGLFTEAPYAPWIGLLQQAAGIMAGDAPSDSIAKLRRLLHGLGLASRQVEWQLLNLLGLRDESPRQAGGDSPQPAERPVEKPARAQPSLFDRLGHKVAVEKEQKVNLWQLTRAVERGEATPAGRMWQRLEAHVAEHEQARLYEAVGGLLEKLAAQTPLVLFVENAHWMDAPSRQLLAYVDRRIQTCPLLVLATERDEGASVAPDGVGATLTLGAFNLSGTTALVRHLLRDATLDLDVGALAATIHAQTEGHPLYVEEVVRWLQCNQAGLALRAAGDLRTVLRSSITLQELVMSRLDSLSHDQRELVKAASVVGPQFSSGDVRVMLDDAASALDESLAGLEAARLTVLLEALTDPRYAFRQMLVREVAYETQSFAHRRELHARLAAALEARQSDTAQQAELIAHHYELANRWIPFARYALCSGHKARQRYAYAQALGYYEQALAALARLAPDQVTRESELFAAQAQQSRGDVALLTGDSAAAAAAYEAATVLLAQARFGPLSESLAHAWVRLALVRLAHNAGQSAVEWARRALTTEPTQGKLPVTLQAVATATLAWLAWRNRDPQMGEWIGQAAALVEPPTERWKACVAAALQGLRGDWAAARRAYLELELPAGAALAACRQGDEHLRQGEIAPALAVYAEAASMWERERDALGLALACYRRAEAHWRKSDRAAATAMLREALALLPADVPDDQDRQAVQAALECVSAASEAGAVVWPEWRWRRYEDGFCARSILLVPLLAQV